MAVSRRNVQNTFYVPDSLNPLQREILADLIIEEIIDRTRERKIDVNGRPFVGYNEQYKESFEFDLAGKSDKPNLTLTGNMLDSMKLISHTKGEIVIGYNVREDVAKQVEGNQIGASGKKGVIGNPDKARPFIGLPKTVLKRLITKVKSETFNEDTIQKKAVINDILDRLIFNTESDTSGGDNG